MLRLTEVQYRGAGWFSVMRFVRVPGIAILLLVLVARQSDLPAYGVEFCHKPFIASVCALPLDGIKGLNNAVWQYEVLEHLYGAGICRNILIFGLLTLQQRAVICPAALPIVEGLVKRLNTKLYVTDYAFFPPVQSRRETVCDLSYTAVLPASE